MDDPIQGALERHPLRPDQGTGEASHDSVTDEIDDGQPQDATVDPRVPSVIVQLGVEARAEYIRARQWLGLSDDPGERLGTVGRYRLEAELGRGGMGIVFRASDPELDRPVAIKLVQAVPFARYDKLRTRLLREAKVLAKLAHPNVVRIYDCGQHQGEVYLAMELVEGATLRDWQRGQSPRSILDAYQQAASGLAAAHELEITHRDFKPDNVLVASDGRVLVGDFGLAGVPAGDELRSEGSYSDDSPGEHVSATRSGALLGTPTYMAPEQLRGEVATALSDQFAFCVSLWEALTGQRPFEGEKREELLEQIEQGRVRGAERLPRRLRTRLMRGLAVDPAARFPHLRDLAEGLVPRRGLVVGVAALTVSLAVGMAVGGTWLRKETLHPLHLCNLSASVTAVAKMPQIEGMRTRPELRPMYDELQGLLADMHEEAEVLCQPANDGQVVRRQWLGMWIDYLRITLHSPAIEDPATFRQALEFIERERWNAPPPRSLSDRVVRYLQQSYSLRLRNDLLGALGEANKAAALADQHSPELALVHLWRGRIFALLGRHPDAMIAYREAVSRSNSTVYTDVGLVAELLMAKTAVMRLGQLERARDALAHAHGLLDQLHEPLLSPRRAAYHETLASILKHEGAYDTALVHQWYALFVYRWRGDALDVGMGYVNLGTIFELRGGESDVEPTRVCYERALEVLEDLPSSPEWFQAALNVGHWLVPNGTAEDWLRAETLLRRVRAESRDAAPSALTDLVLLKIYQQDGAAAPILARELQAMLDEDARSENPSISAERRLDAWQNIANAHSLATDLPAFESARAAFGRVAAEAIAHSSPPTSEVHEQTALLDLTAAFHLQNAAPDRALSLATSTREYCLSPEGQENREMLAATETLIAELRPSTPSAPHP